VGVVGRMARQLGRRPPLDCRGAPVTPEPEFSFAAPIALVLLLGIWPALFLSWRWLRRRYGYRGDISLALRTLGLTCLVVALAQPQRQVADDAISVAYAVDVSSSISPEARVAAWSWLGDALRAQAP